MLDVRCTGSDVTFRALLFAVLSVYRDCRTRRVRVRRRWDSTTLLFISSANLQLVCYYEISTLSSRLFIIATYLSSRCCQLVVRLNCRLGLLASPARPTSCRLRRINFVTYITSGLDEFIVIHNMFGSLRLPA